MSTIKKLCTVCGKEFDHEFDSEIQIPRTWMEGIAKKCPSCWKSANEENEARLKQRETKIRFQEWNLICPTEFHATDEAKLPNKEKFSHVMAWKYGPEGLILFGETRTGKSRSAWRLCEKNYMSGKAVIVMDSQSSYQYAAEFSKGGEEVLNWIEKRNRVPLLYLDDIFKVKLTESFEAALFAIIDYRFNWQLPVIITLNDTEETLVSRMTNDRGSAFLARLKEGNKTIQF